MTEPTHEYRRDVAALLDVVLTRVLLRVGLDELEEAREVLRSHMGTAWHEGWMAGYGDHEAGGSPSKNPFHAESFVAELERRRAGDAEQVEDTPVDIEGETRL